MHDVDQITTHSPWFVALPDTEDAAGIARVILARTKAEFLADHPSERPWILGEWPAGEIACARARTTRLLVIGHHDMDAARLSRNADVRSTADVSRLSSRINGEHYLLAAVDGASRLQGTLLGHWPLFHTEISGCVVVSSRADVLAQLAGHGIDDGRLALHLLFPVAVSPLSDEPPWRGVRAVPPDHCAILDSQGKLRVERRWVPPAPDIPRDEGAAALRSALTDAVRARVARSRSITCDLAGFDSTAVCSLATHLGARVHAFTAENSDPGDDDVFWAQCTVSGLGGVTHEVIPAARIPHFYANLTQVLPALDSPSATVVERARIEAMWGPPASTGVGLHLNGYGGDEVLTGMPAYLRHLAPGRRMLHLLRGTRAKFGGTWASLLRELSDRRSYGQWVRDAIDTAFDHGSKQYAGMFGWGPPPKLMSWITEDARQAIREVASEFDDVRPLSRVHGQHLDLTAMRVGARNKRLYDQISRSMGMTLSAPFYDDRVVETALSIHPEVRITPWEFKPLLVEAMRGIIPEKSLERTTKGHWSASHQHGLRQHRDELLGMTEDSLLVRRGLVAAGPLREALRRPLAPGTHPGAFDPTMACESWLRSIERGPQRF